jgi:hypothetical protein
MRMHPTSVRHASCRRYTPASHVGTEVGDQVNRFIVLSTGTEKVKQGSQEHHLQHVTSKEKHQYPQYNKYTTHSTTNTQYNKYITYSTTNTQYNKYTTYSTTNTHKVTTRRTRQLLSYTQSNNAHKDLKTDINIYKTTYQTCTIR